MPVFPPPADPSAAVVKTGSAILSGNGTTKAFLVTHALGVQPVSINVTPASVDAEAGAPLWVSAAAASSSSPLATWDIETGDFSQFTGINANRPPGSSSVNVTGSSEAAPVSAGFNAKVLALATPAFFFPLRDVSGAETDLAAHGNGTWTGSVSRGEHALLPGDPDFSTYFDGATAYMTAAHVAAYDVGDVFSLGCWIRRDRTGVAEHLIVRDAGSPSLSINTSDQVQFASRGGTTLGVSSNTILADGFDHFIVITKTGATTKFYVDGIDRTGSITNVTFGTTTGGLFIGQRNDGVNFFKGHMAKAFLLPIALSAAQVQALWFTGPVKQGVYSARHTTFQQPAGATNTGTGATVDETNNTHIDGIEGHDDYYTFSLFVPGVPRSQGSAGDQLWPTLSNQTIELFRFGAAAFTAFTTPSIGIDTMTSPSFYLMTQQGVGPYTTDMYNKFAAITYDSWLDFILHVKWSQTRSVGRIGLWLNGVNLIVDQVAQTLDGAASPAPFIRTGLGGMPAAPTNPNQVVLDGLRRWANLTDAQALGGTVAGATTSQFTVNFKTAPPVGSNNVVVNWMVQ